ncbi:type VII secretion target [Amycolatopsis sp. H20-H5]|uniref:type VII secretion target n=1 Tax=Amycolatopsis sp. H20-H5 TaxID=3046309 RepID=UPI002DBF2C4B|nr:type VII secretion target [Amycolatopsis sp. H20-H5]MEC3977795.1 type VII secretion target [Amycolatopsis sp. H20-H5]
MPDGGFQVLGEELGTHAGKVDALAERMKTAVAAAQQVTMDNSAYGVICQPFAALLDPFEEMGVRALQTASGSITGTAGKVRDAAKVYEQQDQASTEAVKKAGA